MIAQKGRLSKLIDANRLHPDHPALVCHNGPVLTYAVLRQLRRDTQTFLQSLVRPWERVALISSDPRLLLPMLLAVTETAVCVPLDPAMDSQYYQDQMQLLGVDWVLCEASLDSALESARALHRGLISVQQPDHPDGSPPQFQCHQEPDPAARQDQGDSGVAFIFTTSGTTSQPKVVPMLYAGMLAALEAEADFYELGPTSVQLLAVPLFRNPAIQIALRVLIKNACLVYTAGVNPKRIADCLQSFPVTHMNLQPAGMYALLRYCQQNGYAHPHQHRLKLTLTGAPLPAHLKDEIEERFQAQLIDQYGMTEVGVLTSTYKAPRGYRAGSVGCPFFKQLRLDDGEILVRNFGMFAGYDDPVVNRDSFRGEWFRTGDVGHIDADGYLFLRGRVREMINRGGEKISPYEIEAALLGWRGIKEAVVFPYPNKQGSDDIGAVIVPNPGSTVSLREMRAALRSRIKPYKLPNLLYLVDEIPTSAAHKIQRNLLYQQLQARGLTPQTLKQAPREIDADLTPLQAALLEMWRCVLDQAYIGLDDDFFDLGGDSLSAAELLSAIEVRLDRVLPVNSFFQQSTIRQMAELLEISSGSQLYQHMVPIRPGGIKPPLFMVHDLHGDVVTYHHLAAHIQPERPVYGFNLNLTRAQWDTTTTLGDIAAAYVEELLRFRPQGPYYCGGLSIGGAIALEMACILQQRGHQAVVIMLDTYSHAYVRKSRTTSVSLHNLLRYSIDTVRQTRVPEIPRLVRRKIAPAGKILMNVWQARSFEQQPGHLDMELTSPSRPEAQKSRLLLSYLHQLYQPHPYTGPVYYFKAARRQDHPDYWPSLLRELTLIEKDCQHTDFVAPEQAGDIARDIDAILTRHEDGLAGYNIGGGGLL